MDKYHFRCCDCGGMSCVLKNMKAKIEKLDKTQWCYITLRWNFMCFQNYWFPFNMTRDCAIKNIWYLKDKKGKKNFRCPQSTPLPRLNGRGQLRKPWVIDITPHNIFPLETFGNHCMYYSQNGVITLITVFIEIVIIFVDWIDGMSLIKIWIGWADI